MSISGLQVHTLLEQMSSEFEEAVQLGGGWTELALPSEEEAQRYFASFRRAPPDNSALVPGTQVRMQSMWIHSGHSCIADCNHVPSSRNNYQNDTSQNVLRMGPRLNTRLCVQESHLSSVFDSAAKLQIAITDEEIVKALVAELVQVMSSAPFAAALKVCTRGLQSNSPCFSAHATLVMSAQDVSPYRSVVPLQQPSAYM